MELQATVGSLVKTGVDGDPLGLVTILNTKRYGQQLCMHQILDFLKLSSPTSEKTKLQQVITQHWHGQEGHDFPAFLTVFRVVVSGPSNGRRGLIAFASMHDQWTD